MSFSNPTIKDAKGIVLNTFRKKGYYSISEINRKVADQLLTMYICSAYFIELMHITGLCLCFCYMDFKS